MTAAQPVPQQPHQQSLAPAPVVGVAVTPTLSEQTMEVFVNGAPVHVPAKSNLVECCRRAGVYVPTLCYHPRLQAIGKCGLCNVEVEGCAEPVLGCSSIATPGMRIRTGTRECVRRTEAAMSRIVNKMRTRQPEAFAHAPELQQLVAATTTSAHDHSSSAIDVDMTKCVECTRCVRVCRDVQGLGIWQLNADAVVPITTTSGAPVADTLCISCGQCAAVCPSGAISEVSHVSRVFEALKSGKICVAQVAPSVRVAIGEEFGMEPGSIVTGQLVWALKRAGFHFVFDTNTGADLTIMEEGTEFASRLKKPQPGPFPMFSTCCPAWINAMEKEYPELIPHMSTCKSPQAMIAAVVKTHWAESIGKKPSDIYHVSIMPCTAKKDEILRDTLSRDGIPDIDSVLTTRECAEFLKQAGITKFDLSIPFDNPIGICSGAGAIFGATGGVMEAVLRTAADKVAGERQVVPSFEMQQCRGFKGIKTADVSVAGHHVRVGVVHGLANIKKFIQEIQRVGLANCGYHFVEIMCCPGGCIGGGGQPKSNDPEILEKRKKAIYHIDEVSELRRSHENPHVLAMYSQWLGEPNSHRSHELLHTHYKPQAVPARELAVRVPAPAPVEASEGKVVAVMYASVSGRSEGVARKLFNDLVAGKVKAQLWPMDTMAPQDLTKISTAIVITSTFGDGERPPMANAVWEWLESQHDQNTLKELQFAVFGLGSKKYSRFNQVAKQFDFKFEGLGAQRLIDIGLGDDTDVDGYSTALEPWVQQLFDELGVAPPKIALVPHYRVVINLEECRPRPPPTGTMYATLLEKKLLTPASYDRPIMLFDLDLSQTSCEYQVGDAIGIHPENSEADVAEFLKWYGINATAVVTVEPRGGAAPLPVPAAVTVQHLFQHYLDIFSPPHKIFLRQLAQFAREPRERERLAFLASPDGASEYSKYIGERPSHVDVLRDFPSAHPTLDFLIEFLPTISPRLYSVASSPAAVGERVQLVIGIPTEIKRSRGKIHGGLATSWLRGLEAGAQVPVLVHPGTLRPPEDTTAPVLLIGLGTGIAPMRALLQDRLASKKAGKPVGPATFFQACRYNDRDFVCQDELDMFKREGVLTKHIGVFSHQDPARFMTVDLAISEDPMPAWEILSKHHGHYLYCGPAAFNIPTKIEAALLNAAVVAGKLSTEAATQLIEKMKAEFRWLIEAF